MQDFDKERQARLESDRSFQIAGETFIRRPGVAPERVLKWVQMITEEITPTEEEAIKILDDTVLAYLEAGQEEKWRAVRSPELENPITIPDMRRLLRWLAEEEAGLPTKQPSDSTTGDGAMRPSSTDASSSPEVVGSAA